MCDYSVFVGTVYNPSLYVYEQNSGTHTIQFMMPTYDPNCPSPEPDPDYSGPDFSNASVDDNTYDAITDKWYPVSDWFINQSTWFSTDGYSLTIDTNAAPATVIDLGTTAISFTIYHWHNGTLKSSKFNVQITGLCKFTTYTVSGASIDN